ncbi:MAG: hypothetical protein RLZZ175_470 [Bacteroidota bacterium]|jgi:hypothetical protein
MKKNPFLFIVLIILQANFLFAKEFEYEGYDWDKTRKITTLTPVELKEQAIIIKDKRAIEYVYNSKDELESYRLIHKIVRVNSDEAIEAYNKVYISMYDVLNIVDLKVRVLTQSGKTIELNKENIKEVENLDNAGQYKIFAIEGAEKKCEIEYYYIIRTTASYFGRELFQSSYPSKGIDFELISPLNLTFSTKSYNGLSEAIREDTTGKKKQVLKLYTKDLAAFTKEEFAANNANKMYLRYKLSANGKTKLFRWSDAAQNIYSNVYYWENEKELKSLDKFLKSLNISKVKTDEEKIILVENYVKNNIGINDDVDKEGYFIETIITKKYASKLGVTRLFAGIFTKLGIKHQLVLTCDRSEEKFDPKFETFSVLDNYLIYFEGVDKYIAPTEYQYRFPLVPYDWTYNSGLLIKPVVAGEMKTAVDVIKFIPATDYKTSFHNHYLDLSFKPDMQSINVKFKSTMAGHNAVYYQPYYSLISDEKKTEMSEQIVKQSAQDAKILSLSVLNTDMNISTINHPFDIISDFETSSVVEKAGNKYILKVGELIGRQSELYQDTKRKQEVENDFNRSYTREINITIPDGYTCKNLNDLNLDVYYEDKGDRTMAFTSVYKLEGNVVKVSIQEYYKNIVYPISIFENYRKVINAAADFNKITLVFEKK